MAWRDTRTSFKAYPTGRMNELVYPVAGGMEDWVSGGHWDTRAPGVNPHEHLFRLNTLRKHPLCLSPVLN